MQSNNTRPNPNTEYGSIQSEAEETHTRTSQIFRQIFPPRILPPQIASGTNIICGVVWISRENRIHPFDGASSKERKKGNAANLQSWLGALLGIGKEFSKISKCEHVFIESEKE